ALAALALPPITGDTRRFLTNAPLLATLSGPLGSTLREFAASRLPEPMVPSTFVVLDALPLTPNGKVDRRALPEPAAAARGTGTAVAPRTAAEREVARVWADVLRIERVGA